MAPDRIRWLEGVQNFRDFGGYAAASGRLTEGRLFRSAHLAAATDADRKHLAGLGLGLVVDLRKSSERQRDPSRLPEACAGAILTSDIGPPAHAPHMAFVDRELTPADAERVMTAFYRKVPFDEAQCDLARRYFQALAERDGAVLVHCAAGKDRTGFLVAMTHAVLGVHRDDIFADYLLTNDATRIELRLPELTRVMTNLYQRPIAEPVIRAFMIVAEPYLATAFAAIEAEHGSVDRYLSERLGVDAALRRRLETRLLA